MSRERPSETAIDRVQRVAGYGAALALVPYAVLKLVWIVVAVVDGGPEGEGVVGTGSWIAGNALTVVMAVTGIAVALALAAPWGQRIPPPLVLVPGWLGTGFLVPLLPYGPLLTLTGGLSSVSADDRPSPFGAIPAWEVALVAVTFVVAGGGIAVAFPLYVRERWPLLAEPGPGRGGREVLRLSSAALVAFGAWALLWAAGATSGLDDAGARDRSWRLFLLVLGGLALLGAWAVQHLEWRRTPLAVALAWTASGAVVVWGGWQLALTTALRAIGVAVATPESAVAFVAHRGLGVVAGLLLSTSVVAVVARQRPRSPSKAPSSSRCFTSPRNRAASAPSTRRWS